MYLYFVIYEKSTLKATHEQVLGQIISKKFLLLFILQHEDMHTYTADHNRLDLQNAEADKVELTYGDVAFNSRTCANVNYDTQNVVFKKSKQCMKQRIGSQY